MEATGRLLSVLANAAGKHDILLFSKQTSSFMPLWFIHLTQLTDYIANVIRCSRMAALNVALKETGVHKRFFTVGALKNFASIFFKFQDAV